MSHRIDKENEINELFPISNRAARSIDLQVNILAKVHLRIGTSKHAEHERIKEENGGKISAHDRGQFLSHLRDRKLLAYFRPNAK